MSDLAFLKEWQKAEYNARHSAAMFLILGSLVFLDVFAIKDSKEREKATSIWVAWGIVFVMIGFFIISPEQEAIQKKQQ